jgi:DNA-binding phage protein
MKRGRANGVLFAVTPEKGHQVKYIDKMLIASGVTLLLTGGVAAAALAPGTADAVITQLPGGVAIFASNSPFGSPNTLATAAAYIGITEADLRTALQTGKTLAQIAVEHGKTRDGLIAALSAEATKQITTAVDQPGTNFTDRGGKGGPGGARVTNDEAAAAAYLGTTEADLRAKEQAGQTLAQIAVAAGKTRDGLIAAMVADGNKKIDAALAAGTITAAQATAQKAALTAHVTAEVDETGPAGGPGRGRRP